jgi:hypothetical protein
MSQKYTQIGIFGIKINHLATLNFSQNRYAGGKVHGKKFNAKNLL